MFKSVLKIGALALAVSAISAGAATIDEVKANIKGKFPAANVTSVTQVEGMTNFYELVLNGYKVMYVNGEGSKVFIGEMFDPVSGKNFTSQRNAELTLAKFEDSRKHLSTISLNKHKPKQKELVVFTDPDCPYCKKLEQELASVNGVNITIVPFPIVELHPNSFKTTSEVLCSKDSGKAWTDYVLNRKQPTANAKCEASAKLQNNIDFAQAFGIQGTPAMMLGGEIKRGYIPANEINAWISEVSK